MDKTSSGHCGSLHPAYEEQVAYFNENKVYAIQIETNLACEQGCLYCYASNGSSPRKEMPKPDVMSVLAAAKQLEVRAIDWLGGDPLLRGDWYGLMIEAKRIGLANNIWTSGMPLEDNEVARKAVEVTTGGFISVHLDTLDEDLYSQLHSGDAHLKIQAILRGIENVLAAGKDPENIINCITFNRLLSDDVAATMQYFRNRGMRTCLTQMCSAGLALAHRGWVPAPGQVRNACEARDRIDYPDSTVSFCTMDTNKFYCGGIICVTVDGDVTPCSVIRKSSGNIHDSPLENIVSEQKDSLLMVPLRTAKGPDGCSGCHNNDVCWGCRATAYYETGDMLAPDPKCYRNHRGNPIKGDIR